MQRVLARRLDGTPQPYAEATHLLTQLRSVARSCPAPHAIRRKPVYETVPEQDPDGWLMLLSCGAALHHVRVTLDAEGWLHHVDRPAGEPLAVVHAERHEPADPHAMHRLQLPHVQHTDRRVVSDEPVPQDFRQALVDAARRGGARLHVLNRDQVLQLAVMIALRRGRAA